MKSSTTLTQEEPTAKRERELKGDYRIRIDQQISNNNLPVFLLGRKKALGKRNPSITPDWKKPNNTRIMIENDSGDRSDSHSLWAKR